MRVDAANCGAVGKASPAHTPVAVMRERMLRIAEALSEQETIAKRRVRRRGHRGRGTVLIIGMMVVACFWAVGMRAGMGLTSATAGEVERGTGLELAVDEASLAGIIRRYYARVPGGMAAALRSAREAAGQKFLAEFPRLRYEAIFEVVPVCVEPLTDENRLRTAESITGDVIEVRRHSSIWATSHRTRWPSWL